MSSIDSGADRVCVPPSATPLDISAGDVQQQRRPCWQAAVDAFIHASANFGTPSLPTVPLDIMTAAYEACYRHPDPSALQRHVVDTSLDLWRHRFSSRSVPDDLLPTDADPEYQASDKLPLPLPPALSSHFMDHSIGRHNVHCLETGLSLVIAYLRQMALFLDAIDTLFSRMAYRPGRPKALDMVNAIRHPIVCHHLPQWSRLRKTLALAIFPGPAAARPLAVQFRRALLELFYWSPSGSCGGSVHADSVRNRPSSEAQAVLEAMLECPYAEFLRRRLSSVVASAWTCSLDTVDRDSNGTTAAPQMHLLHAIHQQLLTPHQEDIGPACFGIQPENFRGSLIHRALHEGLLAALLVPSPASTQSPSMFRCIGQIQDALLQIFRSFSLADLPRQQAPSIDCESILSVVDCLFPEAEFPITRLRLLLHPLFCERSAMSSSTSRHRMRHLLYYLCSLDAVTDLQSLSPFSSTDAAVSGSYNGGDDASACSRKRNAAFGRFLADAVRGFCGSSACSRPPVEESAGQHETRSVRAIVSVLLLDGSHPQPAMIGAETEAHRQGLLARWAMTVLACLAATASPQQPSLVWQSLVRMLHRAVFRIFTSTSRSMAPSRGDAKRRAAAAGVVSSLVRGFPFLSQYHIHRVQKMVSELESQADRLSAFLPQILFQSLTPPPAQQEQQLQLDHGSLDTGAPSAAVASADLLSEEMRSMAAAWDRMLAASHKNGQCRVYRWSLLDGHVELQLPCRRIVVCQPLQADFLLAFCNSSWKMDRQPEWSDVPLWIRPYLDDLRKTLEAVLHLHLSPEDGACTAQLLQRQRRNRRLYLPPLGCNWDLHHGGPFGAQGLRSAAAAAVVVVEQETRNFALEAWVVRWLKGRAKETFPMETVFQQAVAAVDLWRSRVPVQVVASADDSSSRRTETEATMAGIFKRAVESLVELEYIEATYEPRHGVGRYLSYRP